MVEAVDDGIVVGSGRIFELPDGFAVRALGTADSWNGFPVPVLGLVEALRVCLHVSEDADLYLCSSLPDGGFAADGLQWQQRSTDLA